MDARHQKGMQVEASPRRSALALPAPLAPAACRLPAPSLSLPAAGSRVGPAGTADTGAADTSKLRGLQRAQLYETLIIRVCDGPTN